MTHDRRSRRRADEYDGEDGPPDDVTLWNGRLRPSPAAHSAAADRGAGADGAEADDAAAGGSEDDTAADDATRIARRAADPADATPPSSPPADVVEATQPSRRVTAEQEPSRSTEGSVEAPLGQRRRLRREAAASAAASAEPTDPAGALDPAEETIARPRGDRGLADSTELRPGRAPGTPAVTAARLPSVPARGRVARVPESWTPETYGPRAVPASAQSRAPRTPRRADLTPSRERASPRRGSARGRTLRRLVTVLAVTLAGLAAAVTALLLLLPG